MGAELTQPRSDGDSGNAIANLVNRNVATITEHNLVTRLPNRLKLTPIYVILMLEVSKPTINVVLCRFESAEKGKLQQNHRSKTPISNQNKLQVTVHSLFSLTFPYLAPSPVPRVATSPPH